VNSIERLLATVAFGTADRPPVIAQLFAHTAVLAGVPLGDYARDGATLARCQIDAWRHYGHDALFAYMDADVETEAMGSVVRYHDERYSEVATYALAPNAPLNKLRPPDPQKDGRMPEMCRAIRIMRAEAGAEVPVVGVVLGPMTLAVQLMGAEAALYLAADEPERFAELLGFTTLVAGTYGRSQLEAGAHLIMVFDPSASPAVVPPAFFRAFLLERLAELFSAFRSAGAAAAWLHIAGPTEPILGYYPQAGVDIANLDYAVDPGRARQILATTCLCGNILPLAFVLGSADEIAAESRRLVDLFAGGGGFVLSSGCEIPPEAKPENVAAMISAAHRQA
jgi:uroporphyrinogen decarboxylase